MNNFIWTVTPARNKRLLVSGGFSKIDDVPLNCLARLILPEAQGQLPAAPTVLNARWRNGQFQCDLSSQTNFNYVLQYKTEAASSSWTLLPAVTGTGDVIVLSDEEPNGSRYYRVEVR